MSKKSREKETKKKAKQNVSTAQILAAEEWFRENEKTIPEDARTCLNLLLEAALKGKENRAAALAGFHQVLIAWGLKPSSEKTKKEKPPADEQEARKAATRLIKSKREVSKLNTFHRKKWLDAKAQKLHNLSIEKNENSNDDSDTPVNKRQNPKKPSILDLVEFDAAVRNSAEIEAARAVLDLGDSEEMAEAVDADLDKLAVLGQDTETQMNPSEENLFPALPLPLDKTEVSFLFSDSDLQSSFPGSRNIARETYTSKNFDFILQVQELSVSTEIARDRENGVSLSAAPATFALKGFQITLRAMVNLVLLSVVFLLPFHRISRLLGNIKIFHRSNIIRYLGIVASRALPVYLQLLEELAQAEHLWGDATPTRVNEVERALSSRADWLKSSLEGPPQPLPWENLNIEADSEETPIGDNQESAFKPVAATLFEELGYHFKSSRSKKAYAKVRHQTMVLHGRKDKKDPLTHIVIFRSCLGDVGNVLDKILLKRKGKKTLTLQGDHSPANMPQDKEVLKRVNIILAGCLAHLRRPFKRYFDQDPERCDVILGIMNHVFHNEKLLKRAGKNEVNTLAVRQRWTACFLENLHFAILTNSELKTWSDQTPLGKAARSFMKNFKKLGPILNDPYLEFSNNISERLLRAEKLAQGSSYFRDTIEGRARFDILRSLHQTCVCAKISFGVYLLFLLKTDSKLVQLKPADYTPLAVKEFLKRNPSEEKTLLSALLSNF